MLENIFSVGTESFTAVNADLKLIVRGFLKHLFNRNAQDAPQQSELVYFGRELALIPVAPNR
jgi:hypothetical protein